MPGQHVTQPGPRSRELPRGGPWLFLRDGSEGCASVIWQLHPCPKRSCPCRTVELVATPVAGELDAYSEEGGRLHLWFRDGTEQKPPTFLGRVGTWLRDVPAADTASRPARVTVDFQTALATLSESDSNEPPPNDIVRWIQQELDGEVLDALYDEFRDAQGYAVRDEPDRSWFGTWERGELVQWHKAYADAREDRFITEGGLFTVRDYHCVRPGCTCDKATISFFEIRGTERIPAGQVTVRLSSARPRGFKSYGTAESLLCSLWSAYVERHRLPEMLQERTARLAREVGSVLYAAASYSSSTQRAPVSRNAPCPCGSGKKYKKCCGR